MDSSLYLSDILRRAGLDIENVKLIRHSLNDRGFKACYDAGFVKEYTQVQSKQIANGFDYIIVFIGGAGTSAKLEGCYKVNGGQPVSEKLMPKGFPREDMFSKDNFYYNFEKIDMLNDLADRLVIDWGKSARMWHQRATNEKAVLAIQANPKYSFTGYENVVLQYNELRSIVKDPVLYENWHTALSSINAIYLIVDTESGQQYVGSAYGKGGLLGRWTCYVDSKHGHNKEIIDLICKYPDRYELFQFSILQILPKNLTADEVIALENLYKRKLLSKKFGMNEN